jgi:hypothetical protein
VTDTSGICTMLLPEKLVVVFTPNLQSTEGALERIAKAITYRQRSDDLRPLVVYPLPSRIESQLQKLRERWRFDPNFGYQPRFEKLFEQVYGLARCDLTNYFNTVQLPQVPDYAFGEEIAVLVERGADKFSLSSNYADFVEQLLSSMEPWETPKPAETQTTTLESLHSAYAVTSWQSPTEADIAKRTLTRLVRMSEQPEEGTYSAKRVSFADLGKGTERVVERLVKMGVLRISKTEEERFVELADPALVEWIQLGNRSQKGRDYLAFLIWRQRLDDTIDQWRKENKRDDLTLRGAMLDHAEYFAREFSQELNAAELNFITESRAAVAKAEPLIRRQKRWSTVLIIAAFVMGLAALITAIWIVQSRRLVEPPIIHQKSITPTNVR